MREVEEARAREDIEVARAAIKSARQRYMELDDDEYQGSREDDMARILSELPRSMDK